MRLPPDLQRQFQDAAGVDAPGAVVRAMYDIKGNLGETYLACSDTVLVLFSKRVGGRHKRHEFALKDIDSFSVRDDGSYTTVELAAHGRHIKLNFSSWDSVELEDVTDLWSAATGNLTTTEATQPAPAPQPVEPDTFELTPVAIFSAAIYSVAEIDGHVEKGELIVLQESIPDRGAVDLGTRFCKAKGVHEVVKLAGSALNEDQRRCLMANLIAVAMSDGLLRTAEQEALGSYRAAMSISDEDHEAAFEALMARNNLSILADSSPNEYGVDAVTVFCAALYAMAGADNELDDAELALVTRIMDDANKMLAGRAHLAKSGVDRLLDQVCTVLNEAQGRCLMANLISVAMADGSLRGAEQRLFERFKLAIGMDAAEFQRLFDALLLKNNLAIFG